MSKLDIVHYLRYGYPPSILPPTRCRPERDGLILSRESTLHPHCFIRVLMRGARVSVEGHVSRVSKIIMNQHQAYLHDNRVCLNDHVVDIPPSALHS